MDVVFQMRIAVAHMRAFFDLANNLDGQEKVLEREIRILVSVFVSNPYFSVSS